MTDANRLIVRAHALRKTYEYDGSSVAALRGVDLDVEEGSFVAIMGPSGSGKSTLLHLLGALDQPSGGELSIASISVIGADDRALTKLRGDRIGFIFQFFNLLPTLTARDNTLLPVLLGGDSPARYAERADELLAAVGLAERADHLPQQLSGGEQQRVALARALIRRPRLLLADEPTGNLDSAASNLVLDLIAELHEREGRTLVMVTHDALAASRAERVIFLRDGSVCGELPGGDPDALVRAAGMLGAARVDDPRKVP